VEGKRGGGGDLTFPPWVKWAKSFMQGSRTSIPFHIDRTPEQLSDNTAEPTSFRPTKQPSHKASELQNS
jgi:hypothetical protein